MIKFKQGVKYVFKGKVKAPNNVVCIKKHFDESTSRLEDQPTPSEVRKFGLVWSIPDHEQ